MTAAVDGHWRGCRQLAAVNVPSFLLITDTSGNSLQGTIPETLSALNSLQYVELSNCSYCNCQQRLALNVPNPPGRCRCFMQDAVAEW